MQVKPPAAKFLCFIVPFFFLVAGCTKLFDYNNCSGDTDFKACNIKKMQFITLSESGFIDTITYLFTYNLMGNPVSGTNNNGGTGYPNFSFIYDRNGRLSQLVQPYKNGNNYQSWHKYVYNNKGQIVTDTNYANGMMVGSTPQPNNVFFEYIHYTYDSHNRISSSIDSLFFLGNFSNAFTTSYSYDAKGNLITGETYDNKLSLYRTNSIWMFLARDYSVNNPFTAIRYNENGLPLDYKYNMPNKIIYEGSDETKVEYLCR